MLNLAAGAGGETEAPVDGKSWERNMDPNRRRSRNEPKVTPNGSKFGLCLRILTDFLAAHCKVSIVETGGLEPTDKCGHPARVKPTSVGARGLDGS